jgi:hypothetical protein
LLPVGPSPGQNKKSRKSGFDGASRTSIFRILGPCAPGTGTNGF